MALTEQVTKQQEEYAAVAAQLLSDEDWDRIFAEFLGQPTLLAGSRLLETRPNRYQTY